MNIDVLTGRMGIAAATLVATILTHSAGLAQTAVKFSLDSKFEGPAALFFLPLDRGYYKAENLDVTIDPAANALEPITRVASGSHDLGFADINSLIKFRDQNPSSGLKAIFMVYNKPAYSIVARKSRGVSTPRDLEGKKLGAPAADTAFAQWKMFVKANDIDASKVAIDNVGIPVREPMLAAGQVDAIIGLSFSSFVNLKDRGVPLDDIVVMLMADHGVDLYGNVIIVNQKFASENPAAVAGFLRAFLKGLKAAVKDPASAIEAMSKHNETVKKNVELERLRMAIRDNIMTPEVKANGFGGVETARLAHAIDQIALTYGFKTKPKADDVFDDSFLPPANNRRVR